MKLRIIKCNHKFYPQYRRFFFWWYFTEGYSESAVARNSQSEAEVWIEELITVHNELHIPIIVKEYNI